MVKEYGCQVTLYVTYVTYVTLTLYVGGHRNSLTLQDTSFLYFFAPGVGLRAHHEMR